MKKIFFFSELKKKNADNLYINREGLELEIQNASMVFIFEDLEEKDPWLSKSMSDGGDCRTAPATPHCLIVKCGGIYKQQALSNSWARKVYQKVLQEKFLCSFGS